MIKSLSDILKFHKLTKEEIIKRRLFYSSECNRLGIFNTDGAFVDGEIHFTKEERKALNYLRKGKTIPQDLESYLLKTKAERMANNGVGRSHEFSLEDAEAAYNEIYGT